jgi:hypothetical protein
MPPASEGDAVLNTSITMDDVVRTSIAADAAATPAAGTPVSDWLLALMATLCAAHRARQRAIVDRIIRSGLAHID